MTNDHATGLNAALAAQLRAEMAAQRLTQKALSGRSGIPLNSLQRYLAAESAINVVILERLADALGVDPVELVSSAGRRLDAEQGRAG